MSKLSMGDIPRLAVKKKEPVNILTALVIVLFFILLIALAFGMWTAVIYGLWNFLIVPAFHAVRVTWLQSMVVATVMTVLSWLINTSR